MRLRRNDDFNKDVDRKTKKKQDNHKTAQPHTALSIHVYAVVLNTSGIRSKNAIFDDFENFGFLSKIWFLGILGGHWRLGDSGNFNFFDF